ncbi:Exp1p ASCRUDRAFT_74342 [Ascoidea rubescens DSM 1968]|uniref:Uncharacterized protein n=1 Tax=Ascoidea rubescens DSM 1968 TaxID=1344418 RepID=A0A1D2VMP8_9ASCO|nr:hypothetical protein ASCRUDRAFT_74342 [Ascoidea rubescens DSM 1968]ODV62886.1 hypothetical protein ASCRUDRAFT_74342 [Ascoidea rubescens DSM 1968]
MGILPFIFTIIVVILFIVFLPMISGIGSFEIDEYKKYNNPNFKHNEKDSDMENQASTSSFNSYVSPDEQYQINLKKKNLNKSKSEILKEKFNLMTKQNSPITFKTNAIEDLKDKVSRETTYNRKMNLQSSTDPNVFDYNIDEL